MKKILRNFLVMIMIFAVVPTSKIEAYDKLDSSGDQKDEYLNNFKIQTDVEGIVKDDNGNYAIASVDDYSGNEIYIPVGKIDVPITSNDSIALIRNIEGIEMETKNSAIKLAYEILTEDEQIDNKSSTISIFSPSIINNTRNISYASYDGHRMKIEVVSADCHIGYETIASGTSFENTAKAITSIIVDGVVDYAVGNVSNIFGAGKTLLSSILSDANVNTVYGKSENECQIKMRYNHTVKYTYGERTPNKGDWASGLVSFSSTINEIGVTYDFYSNSTRLLSGDYIIPMNAPLYSEHYRGENNLKTAWLNINHPYNDSEIIVKIGKTRFVLS